MIVLMAGLPGTGKSTLARELARRTGGRVVSKDVVRHALFFPEEIEYSAPQDDFCLQVMLEVAGYLLQEDRTRMIFLDGRPFSRRYQIDQVVRVAEDLHQSWRIIECVCDEHIARARLDDQAAAGSHPASNRSYELHREVRSRFEAIGFAKTVIDTGEPLGSCAEQALAALR